MNNSNSDSDIRFDFVRFIKFLNDNNVVAVAIAAVLSERINEFTNILFDNTFLPIINRDSDNDGIPDINKLENISIGVFGIKFIYGKILLSSIKFIFVAFTLFIIYEIIIKKSN